MRFVEQHFLLFSFISAVAFFWLGAIVAIYSLQEVERYLSGTSFLMLSVSLGCVCLSYAWVSSRALRSARGGASGGNAEEIFRLCLALFLVSSVPAFILSLERFISQAGVDYLEMDSAGLPLQMSAYAALYFYFACICLSNKQYVSVRAYFGLFILVMLPRLLLSSIAGRFVAVMPVVAFLLIGFSRGYISFRPKLFLVCVLSAGYVLVVHPMVRAGEDFDISGEVVLSILLRSGPVNLMEQLDDVSREFYHVNFLRTGLVGNVLPSFLPAIEKEDLWKREGLALTADRAFAIYEGAGFEEMFGPGSIYVGELFLIGGWSAIVVGSLVLGALMAAAQKMSSYSTIWILPLIDFSVKVPFVPRSNMTYMLERAIPLLLLALAIWLGYVLSRQVVLAVENHESSRVLDR